MYHYANPIVVISVGSLNNDRTVMARPYAWRPLACLHILKGGSFTNTDVEWQRRRRLSVYHSAMEHIVDDVNEICSTDRHYRFADKVVRCGRGFWHFLSLDGAEIACATLCDTHNCPTCECPREDLDSTTTTYPIRKTSELHQALEAGRARLLNADGSVKSNQKTAVNTIPYHDI